MDGSHRYFALSDPCCHFHYNKPSRQMCCGYFMNSIFKHMHTQGPTSMGFLRLIKMFERKISLITD